MRLCASTSWWITQPGCTGSREEADSRTGNPFASYGANRCLGCACLLGSLGERDSGVGGAPLVLSFAEVQVSAKQFGSGRVVDDCVAQSFKRHPEPPAEAAWGNNGEPPWRAGERSRRLVAEHSAERHGLPLFGLRARGGRPRTPARNSRGPAARAVALRPGAKVHAQARLPACPPASPAASMRSRRIVRATRRRERKKWYGRWMRRPSGWRSAAM